MVARERGTRGHSLACRRHTETQARGHMAHIPPCPAAWCTSIYTPSSMVRTKFLVCGMYVYEIRRKMFRFTRTKNVNGLFYVFTRGAVRTAAASIIRIRRAFVHIIQRRSSRRKTTPPRAAHRCSRGAGQGRVTFSPCFQSASRRYYYINTAAHSCLLLCCALIMIIDHGSQQQQQQKKQQQQQWPFICAVISTVLLL